MKYFPAAAIGFLLLPMWSVAAPTIYRAVDPFPAYHQHPYQPSYRYQEEYSPRQAVQWYQGQPQQYYSDRSRYYPARRSQFSVNTPHVDVHIYPQTQQYYQQTEEVYLPYGGTYRSVTEHAPMYQAPYGQNRVVIHGNYYAD